MPYLSRTARFSAADVEDVEPNSKLIVNIIRESCGFRVSDSWGRRGVSLSS